MDSLKLGFFDTPIHEVTAAAVIRVLEAHGVVNIELITGDKKALLQELQSGELDIFTSLWLPDIHHSVTELVLPMKIIGNLYQPYLFLALPQSVRNGITLIDHLLQADNIDHSVSVPETCYHYTYQAFKTYGLIDAGYRLQSVDDEQAFETYQEIIKSQKPQIMLMSEPGFWDDSDAVCRLTDSRMILGKEQKASILCNHKTSELLDGFMIDELEEMTLGNQVIKSMEHAMRQDGMTADEAAEAWQRGKLIVRV